MVYIANFEMSEIRKKIGLNERYEEWAIHDYEAPFKISEYDDIGTLNEIGGIDWRNRNSRCRLE